MFLYWIIQELIFYAIRYNNNLGYIIHWGYLSEMCHILSLKSDQLSSPNYKFTYLVIYLFISLKYSFDFDKLHSRL